MKKIVNFLLDIIKSDTSYTSRKYKITLLIFFTTSLICALPPCLSVFIFKATAPLIIISGAEYITILTTLIGIYFSANVYEKKIKSDELTSVTNTAIINVDKTNNETEIATIK